MLKKFSKLSFYLFPPFKIYLIFIIFVLFNFFKMMIYYTKSFRKLTHVLMYKICIFIKNKCILCNIKMFNKILRIFNIKIYYEYWFFVYIITIIKLKKNFNLKISKLNIMLINIYSKERKYIIIKISYYYALSFQKITLCILKINILYIIILI